MIDQIEGLQSRKRVMFQDVAITSKDLEEYKNNRPLIEYSKRVLKSFYQKDLECENLELLKEEKLERLCEQNDWELNEDEIAIINKRQQSNGKASQLIEPTEYKEMCHDLLSSPLKYENKIRSLFSHYKRPKIRSQEMELSPIWS